MKRWSEIEINFLKENYYKGNYYCSANLNRSNPSIDGMARILGLYVSKDNLKGILSKSHYRLNENCPVKKEQFINITTPEVAYILGFLWADGHICEESISFSNKEIDASFLREIFSLTGDWSCYRITSKKGSPQLNIITVNRELSSFLLEKNYGAKSNANGNAILEIIPEHLKHYWFRGLLDGDGHITTKHNYVASICSSINQDWSHLIELANKLDCGFRIDRVKSITKKNKLHQHSNFSFISFQNSIKFLDYIYKNYEKDKIGLPRKHDSYLNLSKRYYKL